jgi:hypothetical protein
MKAIERAELIGEFPGLSSQRFGPIFRNWNKVGPVRWIRPGSLQASVQ